MYLFDFYDKIDISFEFRLPPLSFGNIMHMDLAVLRSQNL